MSENTLQQVKQNMPAFLQNQAPATDEFTSGLTGGMPLPTISIRGKEFRLRKDGQEVSTRQRDLEVVFVAAREGISKRWYKEAYVSGENEAPDCSSADGIVPDVANPVNDKCSNCPNNMWGSKITQGGKEGKECSDYKRIIVAPIFSGTIASEPMVLDIPAASLKKPKSYSGNDMMYQEYVTTIAKHEIPLYGVVTTLSFTDAEFPQLCFAFNRFVSEAEFAAAEKMRAMPEVEQVKGAASQEGPGKIEDKTPSQAVQSVPEPTPDPVPDAPADSTPEEVTYPETLAGLKKHKLPQLKKLAEDLDIEPKQKKPELVSAIAEELELDEEGQTTATQGTAPPATPDEESTSATSVTAEEADAGSGDDESVMAELDAILNK